MPDVVIVVDQADRAVAMPLADALQTAILRAPAIPAQNRSVGSIAVLSGPELVDSWSVDSSTVILPLTLAVPETIAFPGQAIYQACRQVGGLRRQAEAWNAHTGEGNFWLPIVLTAKGPLYAEAIGMGERGYQQPIHLPDVERQPLYQLAHRLMKWLTAPPSVYLMQFGRQHDKVWFDRLLPFPGEPALASLGVQMPNLFECHWQCILGQPVVDATIR